MSSSDVDFTTFLAVMPMLTAMSSVASRRNLLILLTLISAGLVRPRKQTEGTLLFVFLTDVAPVDVMTQSAYGVTIPCQWGLPFWGFASSVRQGVVRLIVPVPAMYTASIRRPLSTTLFQVTPTMFIRERPAPCFDTLSSSAIRSIFTYIELQARQLPHLRPLLDLQKRSRMLEPRKTTVFPLTFVEVDVTLDNMFHSSPLECTVPRLGTVVGTSFIPASGSSELFTPLFATLFHTTGAPFVDVAQDHIPLFFQEQVTTAVRDKTTLARFKFHCFYVRSRLAPDHSSAGNRLRIPAISSATYKPHHMRFPLVGDRVVSSVTVSSVIQM